MLDAYSPRIAAGVGVATGLDGHALLGSMAWALAIHHVLSIPETDRTGAESRRIERDPMGAAT
jgi:hypothetical protein